ncbi:beta-phosphoglucomutase family hydrolase [Actinoallomurus oryzae]|jgi:HAD superfamily hydrolase (TIGR01509 family)|uniref:Beta-phosphoglucomutase family hydrolase n=2 Tax=Actinoallomurus oryzae TaxID=502180 RepID=A0ABP8QP07_9ACTN
MMRTRTDGHCVLGEPAHSVTSVIFGVDAIVDAAQASAAAWKTVLDPFLRTHAAVHETEFTPFDVRADYLRFLQGRPRLEGLRDLLAARDIVLSYDDLRGLAMSQEEFFLGEVRRHGLMPFASAIAVLRRLHRGGVRTAAVSVRPEGAEILRRAGVTDLFDVVMDGLDSPGTTLPEHPNAQLYLQAARRLGVSPGQAAVIETSAAGVAAAREAGVGAVVGVDPTGAITPLREHGASPVVTDLAELRFRSARAA